MPDTRFDYQSVCHCSKTGTRQYRQVASLTTSQFVTAPKLWDITFAISCGLTTSQFVTAPKQDIKAIKESMGLTTSQFVTAPKPRTILSVTLFVWLPVSLSLLQNWLDITPSTGVVWLPVSLSLLQNEHIIVEPVAQVWLPVSLSLLQNIPAGKFSHLKVWLPVSLSLLQNGRAALNNCLLFDYQSVCHCSKTSLLIVI